MQGNKANHLKTLAPMIRATSQNQLDLAGFESPFETALSPDNRWVLLSHCIPWDELADAYYQNLSVKMGRPAKDARCVIGAVIIKHKLFLSDEETIKQIQENPYLQYFVGLKCFQNEPVFAPSLFVEIRRRMGESVFEQFHQSIVTAVNKSDSEASVKQNDDDEDSSNGGDKPSDCEEEVKPTHQGKLIMDATVAEQAIRYPTDLGLLNESRAISETLIDQLYSSSEQTKKPRTYRQQARQCYLGVVKRRKPSGKIVRKGIKQQLQYLRRNLGHIERLLDALPSREIPLKFVWLRRYWVIQHIYAQQRHMYDSKTRRCDDRIVSIHQPHVRPIVRGKANKGVEFGSKLGVSLDGFGLASVDHLSWDAYHEAQDLPMHVERYRERHGVYPEKVLADPLYGTRDNRDYLKGKGIHFAGKPLGRPRKETQENKAELKRLKAQRREDYRQRIPIEGKFGQGKNGYGLNYIRAKTARTSEAWINSIFFVMNLLVLRRVSFWLPKLWPILKKLKQIRRWFETQCSLRRQSGTGMTKLEFGLLTF